MPDVLAAADGRLTDISGSIVHARASVQIALGEVVAVGEERLIGEAVALEQDDVIVQVYEDTSGLSPGAPMFATGAPLSAELGPGLLGSVCDGIQRPLDRLAALQGDFLGRGVQASSLDHDRLWDFTPRIAAGALVNPGDIIGTIQETSALEHRIMAPPRCSGEVAEVRPAGPVRVTDIVARIRSTTGEATAIAPAHRWRVRIARPYLRRHRGSRPLTTGQRVLDTFFPLALGSAAGMPGGFGSGKTIMQQQLCRWANADVIVFVGCGERGNEMTELLWKLPDLTDPRSGRPLAERTVMIANTSNMPVPAREASIYTGITIAEYFRDMGYHALLLADSTSRWAEALREISGRLGEIPAEEGYPPYLSSRLAAFYERAGHVQTLGGREGSVTLVSAISPPGGDVTEPVTRHTQRYTGCFWTLDKTLADARVFPAVSVEESYSSVASDVDAWWREHGSPEWPDDRRDALNLLTEASRVASTARLIGEANLPAPQRLTLRVADMLRDGFLTQDAYDAKDASCSPRRQAVLLALFMRFYRRAQEAVERGTTVPDLFARPVVSSLLRAKTTWGDAEVSDLEALSRMVDEQC